MARLELEGVHMDYGRGRVLHDVSLAVEEGELLVLLGPSGCGKSTLLRLVAGLAVPSAGTVRLDGEVVNDLGPRERDVAMVFQSYALYPHMTVRANLAFPLRLRRLPRAEIERRVRATAQLLGLEPLLERRPARLSGGQMQRVALGRAIVREPRLFLFDEPLSNLDARLRTELRSEIARLHARLGVTTLYVTHDQAEAMTLGTRVAVLEAGRLRQVGPPLEVFERPADAFVATFLGSPPMSLVRGACRAGRFRAGPLELAGPAVEGELLLGVRPHRVGLGAHGMPLRVAEVEHLGGQTWVSCDVAGQRLAACVPGSARVAPGETVRLEIPADALHWFDGETGTRLGASTFTLSGPQGGD